ncbi:unnamed protein product [Sphagnum tenellum]
MDSLLEIEGVDQSFRSGFWLKATQVLHNINLSVPKQSVFGFLGANGAGKTTLIHLITGLRKPTSGRVLVQGKDSSSADAKAQIGYLPERPYFHEHLTGEGLLRYFGALSGMPHRLVLERIPSVLSSVDMLPARKLQLRNYSKGMLQRIGIAQALLHDPEFLVLDEPMSGLDPVGRKEMRELILKLHTEGRTIFFSSHVIPDVEAICNQVALIRKGKIIRSGSVSELLVQESQTIEIGFSGVDIQLPEFKSLIKIPEGFRAQILGQKDVNQVLPKLLEKKAQILWVQPVRSSLEDLFVTSYR